MAERVDYSRWLVSRTWLRLGLLGRRSVVVFRLFDSGVSEVGAVRSLIFRRSERYLYGLGTVYS